MGSSKGMGGPMIIRRVKKEPTLVPVENVIVEEIEQSNTPTPKPEVKRIAFTGTRKGMTPAQIEVVTKFIHWCAPHGIFHGGCKGADEQLHQMALEMGIPVVVYPSDKKEWWGNWKGAKVVKDPMPSLERNKIMVDRTTLLVAAPFEYIEQPRGGTWCTMRYAQQQQRIVEIAWRDGGVGFRRPLQPLSRLDMVGTEEWAKEQREKRKKAASQKSN